MAAWDFLRAIPSRLWRLAITSYVPDARFDSFMERAQSQENTRADVTVAVLSTAESRRMFGIDLARRGIQPVFLRVMNRSSASLRLQMVNVDPRYFTPLEAAASSHFSVLRRLSAFGALAWVFLPLLPLVPLKLITAWRANRRMDEFFRSRGFRIAPIAAGETAEGFVFTTLDLGTKVVHVRLTVLGGIRQTIENLLSHRSTPASTAAPAAGAGPETVDFTFTVPVPGIAADYHDRDFSSLRPAAAVQSCTVDELVAKLESLPAATTNASASRQGDPVNLVIIGDFAALLGAFAARWDESESITLQTCWKTARAFLLGSDYRYSPVSSLHLFGRDQDIALQRARRSINERLHLRLWLTRLAFADRPVWVGQVSRDIGVRFTTRAWNLTTHRIDPDVDESRDYVIEDLALAGRVEAAGYVGGVGACGRDAPHRNLTGDPYFTDGKRAVIVLSPTRRA
jgi:hypothetical protein